MVNLLVFTMFFKFDLLGWSLSKRVLQSNIFVIHIQVMLGIKIVYKIIKNILYIYYIIYVCTQAHKTVISLVVVLLLSQELGIRDHFLSVYLN